MKKIVLWILIFFVGNIFGQINKNVRNSEGVEACSNKRKQSGIKVFNVTANLPHAFDVLDYKLDVNLYKCFVTPYSKAFPATEIITLKADSAISSIQLNAVVTSLQIDSVGLAGKSFTHTNDILKITLDKTYSAGDTLKVKVSYSHKSVWDGAFYVNSGLVFTDCEPEGARRWFPCWDSPSDKATLELTAKTPASVKFGSNGRLADSTKNVDTITYHWISRDPIATYLMVMTGKVNYNLDIVYWKNPSNAADSIPFRFYYNARENVTAIKPAVIAMNNYFTNLFCRQPFEKNGFATLDTSFVWGGMENQTLTSLCTNCWGENLVVHEFAHQWFGDMITCATWADIFLNEGFATYCEALWAGNSGGYAAYKSTIDGVADAYIGHNPGWAIYTPGWATTTPNVDSLFDTYITYDKGASVLHQLRYVMGDTLFFAGLKSYANDVRYKYKSATIINFKDVMSQTAGTDLTWFFNEWLNQANHPAYTNLYTVTTLPGNKWTVNLTMKQIQSGTYYYQMPVEFKVVFSDASDTTVKFFNSTNNQVFTLSFNKLPTSVIFDPNNNIVLKIGSIASDICDNAFVPEKYSLEQNYPNPFNPSTKISFSVPRESQVKVQIFNEIGQLVKELTNSVYKAGSYSLEWDASTQPSGVYFCRMSSDAFMTSKKLMLLK